MLQADKRAAAIRKPVTCGAGNMHLKSILVFCPIFWLRADDPI